MTKLLHSLGFAYGYLRASLESWLLWHRKSDADRWLSWQSVNPGPYRDSVRAEQAEGHGKQGA